MGKKKSRLNRLNMTGISQVAEFNRSVSAPAREFARVISRMATSPEILDSGMDSGSIGTSNDGSILTPTDQSILENPLHASTRRDSSGALQSPGLVDTISSYSFSKYQISTKKRKISDMKK